MINLFMSDQRSLEDNPEDNLWNIQVFKPFDLAIEVETEPMVDLKNAAFVSTPPTATTAETLIACLSLLDLPDFSPKDITSRFIPLYINGE